MNKRTAHLSDMSTRREFEKTTASLVAYVASRRPKQIWRVKAVGRHVAVKTEGRS